MAVLTASRQWVLGRLRRAAELKARCPSNPELREQAFRTGFDGVHSTASVAALARAGLIKIEIYGKNYRVVTIDGMRTAEPPHGGAPYRTIPE